MARYGLAIKGVHEGLYTACHAKNMDTCPYHSEHIEASPDEIRERNEALIAVNKQHKTRKAPLTKSRYSKIKRMSGTLLAMASLSVTLAACGPNANTAQAYDAPANQQDYSQTIDKAKSKVKQYANKDSYEKAKSEAKKTLNDYKNSDDYKQLKGSIKDKIKSYENEYGSSSTDSSNSDGTLDKTKVFGETNKNEALNQLNSIQVSPAENVAYKRSEWKNWDSYGKACWNVREQTIVNQQSKAVIAPDGCSITSMTLDDPYTGEQVDLASKSAVSKGIDVDHVVPLGYVAAHGGQAWSLDKKESYANDLTPGHLIATDPHSNRQKGDKGISEWTPPANKCEYVEDFVGVLSKWNISISPEDASYAKSTLASCPA